MKLLLNRPGVNVAIAALLFAAIFVSRAPVGTLGDAIGFLYVVPIVLIDLDRFKQINDELGHAAGDMALCHVAETLRDNLRASDTLARDSISPASEAEAEVEAVVARLGGDEFVAMLPEAGAAGTSASAERLAEAVAEAPFEIDGRRVELRLSIGVATFDEHGLPGEIDLMAAADRAMYMAKAGGGGAKLAAPAA
jgi:GGDEF domain-containing protein